MANQRKRQNTVTLAFAADKARLTMGRPIRVEDYYRFEIGEANVLVFFFSCLYDFGEGRREREYRWEVFSCDTNGKVRSYGGGIVEQPW